MGLFSSRLRRALGSQSEASPEPPAHEAGDAEAAAERRGEDSESLGTVSVGARRAVAANPRALRDSLHQLYSIRPTRESFAEEAIKIIAKSAGVKAAALMGYEQREGRVHLLASVGLEPGQIQALGGESAAGGWDMPLRSLRNRRINVVESAHENPFVPKVLVTLSPRRLTVATLPFYHSSTPVGVVVLFSPTQRGFADGLLQVLSQGLRVCAIGLAELPPAGATPARRSADAPEPQQPTLLRGLAALKAELARLTTALEEAERQRATEAAERVTAQSFLQAAQERAAQLERELEELRGQQGHLPELGEQVEELQQRLRAATEEGEAQRARLAVLEAAHAEHEQSLAVAEESARELTAARDDLRAQLDAALEEARRHGERAGSLEGRAVAVEQLEASLAEAQRGRNGLEAELGRLREEIAALHGQSDDVQARLHEQLQVTGAERNELVARVEALAQAEQERARAQARVEELEEALSAARESLGSLEGRLEEQGQVSARLIAERRELHARIEKLAAGGQTLEQEKQAAINAAQERVTELEAELGRLASQLESARGAAAEELARARGEAESALEVLRAELIAAQRDRDALQLELSGARDASAARQSDLERVQAQSEQLTAAVEELRAARDTAAERVAALEADLADERDAHLAESSRRLAEVERALADARAALQRAEESHAAELDELRDRLASQAQENERLTSALEEKDILLQSAEEGLHLELEDEEEVEAGLDLAIDRSGGADGEGAALAADEDSVEEAEEDLAPDEVLLLEADTVGSAAARELGAFGHRVTSLVPDPECTVQIGQRPLSCAAINLALPSAWATVRKLRNGAGVTRMPLIAYALAPDAAKGFWLGAVDFALLPASDSNLPDILNRLVPKVKRVIAMSNDIDVMSDVRSQLTGAGISTAVVLDGRQALDLVSTVRPEAAVLHLSPSCVDVFRAIAGLRGAEISRDIPILFLLDEEAQEREEAFLAAGVRMLSGRGSLAPDRLVDSLASALGQL